MSSNSLPKIGFEASKSSTIDQTLNYFNCFNILKNAFSDLNITIVEFYKRNGSLVECTLTVTKQGQTWIVGKGEAETKEEAKCNAAKAALIVFLSNNRPVRKSKDGNSAYGGRNREKITNNTSLPEYMEEVKCNIRTVVNGIIDSGKLIKDLTSLSSPKDKNSIGDSESSQIDQKTSNSSSREDPKDSNPSSSSDQIKSSSVEKLDANYTVLDIKKALSPAIIEEILNRWHCFIPLRNAFKTYNINVIEFYIRNGDKVDCTLTVTKDGQTWILGKGDGGGKKKARNSAATCAVKTFLEKKFPVRKKRSGSCSRTNNGKRRNSIKSSIPDYMYQVRNSLFLMAKNIFKDLIFPKAKEKEASENSNALAAEKEATTSAATIQDTVVSSTVDQLDQTSISVVDEVKNSIVAVVEQERTNSTTVDHEDLHSTSEVASNSTSTVEMVLSASLIETVVEKWNFDCLMHLKNAFKKSSININDFYIRNKQVIECTLTVAKDGETWSLGKGEGETKDTARRNAAKCAVKMFLENKSPVTKSDKLRRRVRKNRPLPEYMNIVRTYILKLANPIVQKEMKLQNCTAEETTELKNAPEPIICDEDEAKPLPSNNRRTDSINSEDIFKGLSDEEGEGLVMSVVNALVSSFDRIDNRDTDLVEGNHSRENKETAIETQTDFHTKIQSPTEVQYLHQPKIDIKINTSDELISVQSSDVNDQSRSSSTESADANNLTELKENHQPQLPSNQNERNELHELLNYLSQLQIKKKKENHSQHLIIPADTNEIQNDLNATSQPEIDSKDINQIERAKEVNSDEGSYVKSSNEASHLEINEKTPSKAEKWCAKKFSCLTSQLFFFLKSYQKFETNYSFLIDSFKHSGISFEFQDKKIDNEFESTLNILLKEGDNFNLGIKRGKTEVIAQERLASNLLDILLKLCYTIVVKKEIVTDSVISLNSLIDASKNELTDDSKEESIDASKDELTASDDSLDLETLSEISSQATDKTKDTTDSFRFETLDDSSSNFKENLENLLDKMTQQIQNEELVPDLVFSSELADKKINYIQLLIRKEEKYQMLQSTMFESDSKRYVVVSEVLKSPSLFKRVSLQGGNTEKFAIFNPGTLLTESIRESNVI